MPTKNANKMQKTNPPIKNGFFKRNLKKENLNLNKTKSKYINKNKLSKLFIRTNTVFASQG